MKKIILFAILLGLTSLSANAQTRSLRTEEDGFQWYKTYSSNMKYEGAESVDGKTLIPLSRQYTFICYQSKSGHKGYFNVKKGGKEGACDIYGREIIAPKYKFVFYYSGDGFNYEDAQGNNIPFGITLDANGRASSYGHTGSTSSTTRSASSAYNNSYQQPPQQQTQQKSTQIDVIYADCSDLTKDEPELLPMGKNSSPIEYIARFEFGTDQITVKLVKVERTPNSKETIIMQGNFKPKNCVYKEKGNSIIISDDFGVLTVDPNLTSIMLERAYEGLLLDGYVLTPLGSKTLDNLLVVNEYASVKRLALEEQKKGNLSKKVKEVASRLKTYSYKNR